MNAQHVIPAEKFGYRGFKHQKQCTQHLSTDTYEVVNNFPENLVNNNIQNVIISFKKHFDEKLYKYLLPISNHRPPRFYGLPKVHKNFDKNPPLRLILAPFCHIPLDHVLQPLTQSYPDYLQNSTSLINIKYDHKIVS